MATEAHLAGNRRYLATQDDIRVRVPKGKRDEIKQVAKKKGYTGLQPYIKALIEKDSGIKL